MNDFHGLAFLQSVLVMKILANGNEKQYNKVHKSEGKTFLITFEFVHNDERM